jgi:hypothetical protein
MQCNIDARGKRVRLISGMATLLVGLVLGILTAAGLFTGVLMWALTALLILTGAFQIFEARKGWCVVRAMGIKTPV